jgi:hypothetical protein
MLNPKSEWRRVDQICFFQLASFITFSVFQYRMLQDCARLIFYAKTLKKMDENRNRLNHDLKVICTNDIKILLKKEARRNINEDNLFLNWILMFHYLQVHAKDQSKFIYNLRIMHETWEA